MAVAAQIAQALAHAIINNYEWGVGRVVRAPLLWRFFMQLTASQLKYLLAIAELSQTRALVSSSDIADKLKVTRPSVNKMLEVLSSKELLEKKRYGTVRLTDFGVQFSSECTERVMKLSIRLANSLCFGSDDIKRCAILLVSALPDLAF